MDDATAGALDDQVTKLEKEIEDVQKAITEEEERLAGPTQNEKLNLKASIGVFAEFDGEIKIALIYGASHSCSMYLCSFSDLSSCSKCNLERWLRRPG